MDAAEGIARAALGLAPESKNLNIPQIGLRAALIYVAVVLTVRLYRTRSLGGSERQWRV